MESAKYFILVGVLLLVMALSPSLLKRIPLTSSVIYLLFGLFLGRHGLNIISLEIGAQSKLIEVISEVTVIISLFTVGLKLRWPLRDRTWFIPLKMASLSMIITVGMISLLGHFYMQLSWGYAILLGAILAPTDPVLASEVQLSGPRDEDRLKFNLTSEGGLNDGMAFPFVMLGLGMMGVHRESWSFFHWLSVDLFWAVLGGLGIGTISGYIISKLVTTVRQDQDSFYLKDFLTIASIALSYGLAIYFKAYGFLAVFANALTIRQIELKNSTLINRVLKRELPDEVLSFNEQLERIMEVVSVVLVGLLIDLHSFSFQLLVVVGALFLVIRPLAIFLGLAFSPLSVKEKGFLAWFGVRGIGSVYYLFFALNQNPLSSTNDILIQYTLGTIFFSILIHGCSVTPIMKTWKQYFS